MNRIHYTKIKSLFYSSVVILMMFTLYSGCKTNNFLGNKDTLLFPAIQGNQYCYINNKGDVIIPPSFDDAGDFYSDRAIVKIGEKYGVINQYGDFILKPTLPSPPMRFFDGFSVINQSSISKTKKVYDKYNHFIFSLDCENISPFKEFIASFKSGKKWGYVNSEGIIIIKPKFEIAGLFSEGNARVNINQKWGYIDNQGNLIIHYIYDTASDFINNKAVVSINKQLKLIDKQNNIILNFESNIGEIIPSYDDLWPAYDLEQKKFGFYSISKKKWIINAEYDLVNEFSEGLAVVMKMEGDKYKAGAINKKGNVIIPLKYDGVGSCKNGILPVSIDIVGLDGHQITAIGYVNKKGKYIWRPQLDPIDLKLHNKEIKDKCKGYLNRRINSITSPIDTPRIKGMQQKCETWK